MSNKIFYFFVFGLLFALTSCNDDENLSESGSGAGFGTKVYIGTGLYPTDRAPINIIRTPLSTVLGSEIKFLVRITTPIASDLEVTLEVDNSLVAAFNEANKTKYSVLPQGAVVKHTKSVVIAANAAIATDSVRLESVDLPSNIEEATYLIPIKIAGVRPSKGGVQISSNLSVFYIIANAAKSNIDISVLDFTGDVYEKTGWSVTASSEKEVKYAVANAIDGNNATSWITATGAANTTDALLTIDMSTSQLMNAIRITPNFAYSGTSYAVRFVEVYTSMDGVNWEKQGKSADFNKTIGSVATPTYKWVKFYIPVAARYFQFKFVQNWSTSYVGVGEVDVVK